MCTTYKVHKFILLFAKFEHSGTKTVGVTDNTNQTPSKNFTEKMFKVKTPQNEKKS